MSNFKVSAGRQTIISMSKGRARQLQADAILNAFDTVTRAQDIRYAPVTLVATSVGATAASFGATIALL